MRQLPPVPVRVVAHDDGRDLLDAALTLAQTQLVGQLVDETSLDARTMGTLGFSGALLAADLAAKGLLGALWWTPLVAIGAATLRCLGPVIGIGVGSDTDLGPSSVAFYQTYGGHASAPARQQLLADLGASFRCNAGRLKAKRRALRSAVAILVAGLTIAAVLVELDRASTINRSHGTHVKHAAA